MLGSGGSNGGKHLPNIQCVNLSSKIWARLGFWRAVFESEIDLGHKNGPNVAWSTYPFPIF
jgi:hypothetical protein